MARTAVLPLCLGNAVQWYDFALYGAFATIIGPVFFPVEDPSTVLLAAFAVYATALIIRPVGALIFGRMADLRGRRAVFVPIMVLMAGGSHGCRRLSAGLRKEWCVRADHTVGASRNPRLGSRRG